MYCSGEKSMEGKLNIMAIGMDRNGANICNETWLGNNKNKNKTIPGFWLRQ